MRLGFAKQPLTYEDILWPGETAPRPQRTRRKGRRVEVLKKTLHTADRRSKAG